MSRGAFSPATKRKVVDRQDGGCWICGKLIVSPLDYSPLSFRGPQYHHRLPRRAGGRFGEMARVCASPANALLLCESCHRLCELDRTYALAFGFLVAEGHFPTTQPVFDPQNGSWWLLDSNGGRAPSSAPRPDSGVAA